MCVFKQISETSKFYWGFLRIGDRIFVCFCGHYSLFLLGVQKYEKNCKVVTKPGEIFGGIRILVQTNVSAKAKEKTLATVDHQLITRVCDVLPQGVEPWTP